MNILSEITLFCERIVISNKKKTDSLFVQNRAALVCMLFISLLH